MSEAMTIEEAFARLAVCVEHGKIVNGFPTCVRLNEPKAKRILAQFAESVRLSVESQEQGK